MLGVWWHQTITWTNIDLKSMVFYGVHRRAISTKFMKQSTTCVRRLHFQNYSHISQGPNLTALKFSPVNKIHIFQCMGKIFCVEFQRVRFLCGISKGTFEIPHKISYPYTERYDFYTKLKFYKLLDLRGNTQFWNAPWSYQDSTVWVTYCYWGRRKVDLLLVIF